MTIPNSRAVEAPAEARQVLETVYRLFNARDIDGVFRHMHANVDWPNGMEGGRVHGYDEVRAYWTRQWSFVDPHVEPTAFTRSDDGRILIDVHQVIKDLAGHELINQHIEHLYTLEDGRIRRMDIGRVFPSTPRA